MASYSTQAHIGRRVLFIVLWTTVFIVGLAIGVLTSVRGLADLIAKASPSVESQIVYVAVSVAMVLIGLWGISASHRNLRHNVDLLESIDEARRQTIQLETTRVMSKGK